MAFMLCLPIQLSIFHSLLVCSKYTSLLLVIGVFLLILCMYVILGTGATPQASAAANGVSMSYLGPGGLGDSLTSDERYTYVLA